MKHFVNIAKLFTSYIIVTLAVVLIFEASRLRDTRSAMTMFSRIAGNYALTASQDVGRLTNNERIGRVSCMYNRDEYKEYIDALGQASIECNGGAGDASLQFIHELLLMDYNRACSEAVGSTNLDPYLKYTPLAFNLPYISKNMLIDCYSEAMIQMVANYKCNGKPSVFVPASSSNYFNMSSDTPCVVSIEDAGSTGYANETGIYGGGNTVAFRCVPISDELLTSIYGSTGYYNDNIKNAFSSIDPYLYDDPRFTAFIESKNVSDFENSTFYIPMYNIQFTTPYYYITGSSILSFGRQKLFFGTGNAVANAIESSDDLNVYRRERLYRNLRDAGYNVSNPYYGEEMINEGQLMMHMSGMNATSNFEYTFLS